MNGCIVGVYEGEFLMEWLSPAERVRAGWVPGCCEVIYGDAHNPTVVTLAPGDLFGRWANGRPFSARLTEGERATSSSDGGAA